MSYLKLTESYWDSMTDTGFGDRISTWSYAYELNKLNDFNFTIIVDDFKWRETKYLNFPCTETEKNIDISNCESVSYLKEIDISKNYIVDSGLGIDYAFISNITLKDKSLEDKIKESVKDRIGIHIRHWPIFEEDKNHNCTIDRFDYESKMNKVREVLDKYNSKFYISSDVTYDRPPFGPCLPDYRKEKHWLSEVYKEYDVIDYRDIMLVDDIFPIAVEDDNNQKWLPIYDEEVSLSDIKVVPPSSNKLDIVKKDMIYDIKIKRDIVDLFSLIYSKDFISSSETGIDSSWSEFVECYRWN